MNSQGITITNKLTPEQRETVANLVYDAFGQKLRTHILAGDVKTGENCIKESLNTDCGLFAVKDNIVLGFAGLDYGKSNFHCYDFGLFKRNYGFFGALWRTVVQAIFSLFFERFEKNSVHIGELAVSDKARGTGIGTLLLHASFDEARKLGYNIITLEVVDTNPRAQKLYEKLGFKVTKSHNFGRITQSAGFASLNYMSKQLD